MADGKLSIQIAGVTPESVVDGPGLRAVVFFPGLPPPLSGCHNPDTWDPRVGSASWLMKSGGCYVTTHCSRALPLSGGEPLDQPEGALALARKARAAQGNVMIYTGYTWEELSRMNAPVISALLKETALLVDGPFRVAEKDDRLPYRGSRNQRIIDVQASLGKQRPVLWAQNGGINHGLASTGE